MNTRSFAALGLLLTGASACGPSVDIAATPPEEVQPAALPEVRYYEIADA